jgi:hypothetical protein
MGIEALDFGDTVGRGVGQERDDFLLLSRVCRYRLHEADG